MIIQLTELREIPAVNSFFETILAVPLSAHCAGAGEGFRRRRRVGECTAGEGPFYSDEWTETAWITLLEFLAPMVAGKEIENAAQVFSLMKPVRGHRMAKAAIENACWDLEAIRAGEPLWSYLGGTQREIPCGVSIGIQDSPEILLEKIQKEVDAVYQRIK